jgi:hypothetical protein
MIYLLTFALAVPAVYAAARLIIHAMDKDIQDHWKQEAPCQASLIERAAFKGRASTEASLYRIRRAAL